MKTAKANTVYAMKENTGGGVAAKPCLFSFRMTGDAFVFSFSAKDDDLFSPCREDNGPLYKGDAVEIFISPDGDRTRYYELEVSPFASRFYACVHNPSAGRQPPALQLLPPCYTASVTRWRDGYDVRITLRFGALPGFDEKRALFNAFRLDYAADGSLSALDALEPTLCDRFHRPAYFVRPIR